MVEENYFVLLQSELMDSYSVTPFNAFASDRSVGYCLKVHIGRLSWTPSTPRTDEIANIKTITNIEHFQDKMWSSICTAIILSSSVISVWGRRQIETTSAIGNSSGSW